MTDPESGRSNEPFVHPQGICESGAVGARTRVWAFAHVLPGARIGTDCNICDMVFIENDVVVGDRVTIKSGVQLWDGLRIADDVFIGPNVTFTNDAFPRSKVYPTAFARTVVEVGASIGANATILPGLTIGARSMVGAGAVVTGNVPPGAIVVGNPARIIGYEGATRLDAPVAPTTESDGIVGLDVAGVELWPLRHASDLRGSLTVAEFADALPFDPQRVFLVYDVPSERVRGEHAHRRCAQFLVCAAGELSVVVDDGTNRAEVRLDRPSIGLHIPPLVWGIQYRFSPGAVLMVLASIPYDSSEYIRDYDEFLSLVEGSQRPVTGLGS